MRRKLIQALLTAENLDVRVLKLLPLDAADLDGTSARLVLTAVVTRFRSVGSTAAEPVYSILCSSMPAQLADFLKGTPAGRLSKQALVRVQSLLTPLLTSRAGRPSTGVLSRREQLAIAQAGRRERLSDQGRKQINIWVAPETADYLKAIQYAHKCETQAEAIDMVLAAAVRGEVLRPEKGADKLHQLAAIFPLKLD